MHEVFDRAKLGRVSLNDTSDVAFRRPLGRGRSEVPPLSRLNTQPARTPINASPPPLRMATHDSGPVWFATPSPYDSFIHNTSSVLVAQRAGVRGQSKREPLAAENPATYGGEFARKRTEQSFLVPKADIAAQGYDLSLNRYKEVIHEEVAHCPPSEILQSLSKLEVEIQQGMKELEEMLN